MIVCIMRHNMYYRDIYVDIILKIKYRRCMKKTSKQVYNTAAELGESLKTWRRVYELKASQVAERSGISPGTLSKIENGDPSVSLSAFLEVVKSVGLLDSLAESLDPLNHDLGRARVTESLPKRVR